MKRKLGRAVLEIVSVAAIWAVPATAQSLPGFGIVMTYNVNEGSDFVQVEGATSLQQFLIGVGAILTQVQGTNPPERMQAVAKQIPAVQPELLSLQEVDQWYSGTFDPIAGKCGVMMLQYDMLQELQFPCRAGRSLRSCRAGHPIFIHANTRTNHTRDLRLRCRE
jgi:hypothetical protein